MSSNNSDIFRVLLLFTLMLILSIKVCYAQNTNNQLDSVINSLKLKEVIVTAKKIKQAGDTISYSAATYRSQNDKTLSDLLRNMPGIEIKSNGQIMYNGQWINEFYIEGMDMLGENYSVATKNLDAQAIGSVQILQDHQNVKMLQGIRRGSAPAMNITLKQSARGVWSSTIQGAIGGQPKISWDASATLMNFKQKSQNISVAKSNNIGVDLRPEMDAPSTFNSSYGTGILYPELPSLDNKYAYNNCSHSISVNQLFKLNEDKMLSFNINYLFDKENRESKDVTTYLTDSTLRYVIEESNQANIHQHFIGANAVYKYNGEKSHLKNKLSVNVSFPKGEGIIDQYVQQNYSGHSVSVVDVVDINWKKPNGGLGDGMFRVDFNDKEGLLHLPDSDFSQMINQSNVKADGSVSLLAVSVPHFKFNLNAGGNVGWEQVKNSHLLLQENLQTLQAGANFTPKLLWHYGQRFQFLVYVPTGIIYYKSENGAWDYDKALFSIKPYTNIAYKPSDKMSFSLTAMYDESLPTALSLISQGRYINYRTTMSNPLLVEAEINRTFKAALNGSYSNVLDMLFGSVSFSYVYSRYPTSSSYEIEDDIINYIILPYSTFGSTYQFDQTYSKGFFLWNSKISESFTIGTSESEYLVEDAMHVGKSNYLKANLSYNASFAKWITFDTSNDFTISKPYTDSEVSGDSRYSFANSSSLVVWPTKSLCIMPSVMYYHNNYSTAYRNNVFLNCNLEYTIGSTILSVKCSNLFDSKIFHRYTDNGIVRYSSEYKLRGRTIMLGIRIKLT